MSQSVFITGFPRSGTSLAVRLLGDTTGRRAFSQPLPLLLSYVRQQFLASLGRDADQQAYPFSDDQYENFIAPEAFSDVLSGSTLTAEALRPVLEAMQDYPGQYFKPDHPLASLAGWTGAELADFASRYFNIHGKGAGEVIIWKEIAAESVIAYLAHHGWQGAVVIRDPRDAIASMLYGTGREHAGDPRPLLFMARQWRRSALYALAQPFGLVAVRYEDMLADPVAALGPLAGDHPVLIDALLNRHNSSFSATTDRQRLSVHATRFVEAVCHAEMTALGYPPELAPSEIDQMLANGPGEEALHRPVLKRFLWSQPRLDEERQRRAALASPTPDFQQEAFLFEVAYTRLREEVL